MFLPIQTACLNRHDSPAARADFFCFAIFVSRCDQDKADSRIICLSARSERASAARVEMGGG
jgi:hypothetical protein